MDSGNSQSAFVLTLTITSLVISLLSAAGAIAAAWWTRRASTRQCEVLAVEGLLGPNGMLTSKWRISETDLRRQVDQGFTRRLIGVKVINTGAIPLSVERWSLNSGPLSYVSVAHHIGPELPCIIPGGSSALWMTDWDVLEGTRKASTHLGGNLTEAPTVTVEFGDGRARKSKPLRAR